MPYYTGDAYGYRGDYYRGDYYRGDPGLFSFVGKALGGVAKIAVGAVKGALGLQSPGSVSIPVPYIAPGPPQVLQAPQGIFSPGPSLGQRILDPGTAITSSAAAAQAMGMQLPGMKGYHWNKSTYITRGGGTSRWPRSLSVHAKFTVSVKNRHMNVANAHALRRAIRRVAGFAKIVKRSRRAIARAASAVGVHRGRPKQAAKGPSVRIVKAA